MSDDFNPYKQWLGLDDDLANPNYYQLLGIEPFEEDPVVISQAADRARSRVRSFRPGPHARHWAHVLDELSRAKTCLTDRIQKQQYDEQLRGASAGRQPAAPAAADNPGRPSAVNPDLYPPGMFRPGDIPLASIASQCAVPPDEVPTAIVVPQTMIAQALKFDIRRGDGQPGGEPAIPAASSSGTDHIDPMAPYRADPPSAEAESDASQPGISGKAWSERWQVALPVAEPATGPNAAGQQRLKLADGRSPVKDATRRAGQHSHLPLVAAGATTLILVTLGVLYTTLGGRPKLAGEFDAGPSRPTLERPASGRSSPQADRSSQLPPTVPSTVPSPPQDAELVLREMLGSSSANEPDRSEPPRNESEPEAMPSQSSTTAAPSMVPRTVPQPAPPTAPAAAVPMPTREEILVLDRALTMARTALSEKNVDDAAAELNRAAALAKTPEQQDKVARLRLLAGYVRRYVEAVDDGRAILDAGHELKISDTTIVLVVESRADLLIVRVAGVNRRYPPKEIPTVLALLIADRVLPPDDPDTWLIKGAAYAIEKDQEKWSEARSLWEKGRQGGADVDDLMKVLDED